MRLLGTDSQIDNNFSRKESELDKECLKTKKLTW